MNKYICLFLVGFTTIILLTACSTQVEKSHRKQLFDDHWQFHRGAVDNGEALALDDSSWRVVNLPHDWSIEHLPNQTDDSIVGPFSKASAGGFATGQTLGGEGWYRKHFTLSPAQKNKRLEFYFEGIYNQSEIWINGKKAYENVYGYTSFRFDITSFCNPVGEENVIAVKVLNEGKNSRWYTGSGIYRHVWLLQTANAYIDDWGVFARTLELKDSKASLAFSTSVVNGSDKDADYTLELAFSTEDGQIVAQASKAIKIEGGKTANVDFNLEVNKPELWSPGHPYRYTTKLTLKRKNKTLDAYSMPFGIRTIDFSVEEGFKLNGEPTLLKGACVHHDNGLLGAAAFDSAEERKIELLKANGYNAVRTAHNPMSESFMEACDRLGMLVIDEAFDQWNNKKNTHDYHLYFKEWSAKDIRALVLRDRNRPSVIMWSIGNEIRERITDKGRETAKYLRDEIRKYDITRPVTAGVNKHWNKDRSAMLPLDNAIVNLDVAGYNYMWRFYEDEHQRFPNKVMYSSESVAMEASENWDKVEELPYVIGDFIWTAMDYLGESGLGNTVEIDPQENVHQFMGWPWFNGWCGDIDLIGIKKPQSYYRDVIWNNTAIAMAVEEPIPTGKIRKVSFWGWKDEQLSWTFSGQEGKSFKVNVYSRAPKVKLYLNEQLIGEQATNEKYQTCFDVPYQEGKLRAVARINGKDVATSLQTVGKAVAIRLTADKQTLRAGGQDLSYILIEAIDQHGNVVLDDSRVVNISCKGVASVVGSGNACPTDMKSFGSLTPQLCNGRAMVIVRSGKNVGEATVKVDAKDLAQADVILTVE